ncbi:MAG: permease-like cell division protein FtsX [Gammaproteobacteria bacterium]|nr:permease-like cell division protein FtsX [Gammaproteobacteria bacterium]MCF6230576.1 permease-like cell division protein FtsX [Gammaproteobacteria bacterium]
MRIKVYFQRHLQVFMSCLGQFYRAPISHFLTVLVIAISLSLPALLLVALENARSLVVGWDNNADISLFLNPSLSPAEGEHFKESLLTWRELSNARYISAEQSLHDFKAYSGFGEVLEKLDKNPLPAVIVLTPRQSTPETVLPLLERLQALPEVELAQLDLAWLTKIYAMMSVAERVAWVLGLLLAIAVVLIVGNTVRVGIQQRRVEIEVCKLVGGTNGFIRRPFLYMGAIQGGIGGLLAIILVASALLLLNGPITQLAALYQSSFKLEGLGLSLSLLLLLSSITLGWLGSLFTVNHYMREIEPS